MTLVSDSGAIAFEAQPAELPALVDELYTFQRPRRVNVTAAAGAAVNWIQPIIDRFQAIAELPDDWDGYGSPPPGAETLIVALEVLQLFMPAAVVVPAVAPTTTGGVQFEWHQSGWDIEVEVTSDGHAVAWGENIQTQETFHGSVEEAREDLVLNLKRLTMDADRP